MKQIAAALQEGVGRPMRQAGLELMQLVENDVRQLAGERSQRRQPGQGYRWGREGGFLIVDGQENLRPQPPAAQAQAA